MGTSWGKILRTKTDRSWACPSMSGGRLTQRDSAGAAPVWCGCRLECTRLCAHWRHLANTIELSSYYGDAALYQITLTTCHSRRGSA